MQQQPANIPPEIVAASVQLEFPQCGGSGTVVYVDRAKGIGLVLTNRHIIEKAGGKEGTAKFPSGVKVPCEILAVDRAGSDLAAVSIPADTSTPMIPVADRVPPPGTLVCQVGYGGFDPQTFPFMQQRIGILASQEMRDASWDDKPQTVLPLPFNVIPGDSGSGVFAVGERKLIGVVWGYKGRKGIDQQSQCVSIQNVGRFAIACRPLLPWRRGIEQKINQPPQATPPAPPPNQPPVQPPAVLPDPPAPGVPDDLMAKIRSDIDALKAAVAGVDGKATDGLSKLGQVVDGLKGSHSALATDLAQVSQAVKDLKGGQGSLADALSKIAPAVADAKSKLEGLPVLGGQLGELEKKVAAQSPIIAKIAADAGALGPALSPLLLGTGPAGLLAALGALYLALKKKVTPPDAFTTVVQSAPPKLTPASPVQTPAPTATPATTYLQVPAADVAEKLFQEVLDTEAKNSPGTAPQMAKLRSWYDQKKAAQTA